MTSSVATGRPRQLRTAAWAFPTSTCGVACALLLLLGAAMQLSLFSFAAGVASAGSAAAAAAAAAPGLLPGLRRVPRDGGGGGGVGKEEEESDEETVRVRELSPTAVITRRAKRLAASPAPAMPPFISPPPVPPDEAASPVDAVWTHVSDADPAWRSALIEAVAHAGVPPGANRFRDHGELRFSMRSVWAYAGWVRDLIVVVASPAQVPAWLNASHPRVRVVLHAELFAGVAGAALPTFNSLAIESVLHRIPGLSPRFLYLNNDVMLGRPAPLAEWAPPGGYTEFTDFLFAYSGVCADLHAAARAGARPGPTAASADDRECRASRSHFYNALIAAHFWGEHMLFWPAHAPRLWHTRVLAAIEAALAEQLRAARGNALRNPQSDVAMHVQHEAYLRAAARAPGQLAVHRRALDSSRDDYRFIVFDASRTVDEDEISYAALARDLGAAPPLVLAIEDDMLQPSQAAIDFHGAHVRRIMRQLAPNPAPWELPVRGGGEPGFDPA